MDAIGEIQEASMVINRDNVDVQNRLSTARPAPVLEKEEEFDGDYNKLATPEEPANRSQLPWLKDPSVKMGLWAIIKDNIGKDLSKLAVPVFFNEPLSLTQKSLQGLEYAHIIEKAAASKGTGPTDGIGYRLALTAVYSIANFTCAERNAQKPFNPMLGETYELIMPNLEGLAEQVSHHPPVAAAHVRGKKANFTLWTNLLTKTKFQGRYMDCIQQFRSYIEYPEFKEKYEIEQPVLSVHNLIIGTPYVDIGGGMKVNLVQWGEGVKGGSPVEYCAAVRFTKKGWFARDEYKVEGDVYHQPKGQKKPTMLWKIHGNWNTKIYVSPYGQDGKVDESRQELVFDKYPYPDKWDYQYGMSNYSMQLNYFPSWLDPHLPPTDTRRRPDQRLLEHGDMVKAAKEKDRLEVKQR